MKLYTRLSIIILAVILTACNKQSSLLETTTQYIRMNDSIKIAFKEYGDKQPTLVFIHGFGCDMNAWNAQISYFQDKYKMIFIDLPGYGQSDKPHTEYTLDFYADAVKTVLDSLKIQNAILIGHSLGTAVSRQIEFNYPELASKLVDIDGVYCFYPEDSVICAENEKQYKMFVSIFQGSDISNSLKEFITPLFIDKTPENVKKYALTTMTKTPPYIAYSTMKNLVEKTYWTNEIIKIPSLIIASKNSQIPPDYEQTMSSLYSKMDYIELDSIGHFIMMENPELFNRTLENFINK